MAIEVAMEDDVFYADLNRRISMLIDEDDDVHVSKLTSFSPREFPRVVVHPPILLPSQYDMYQASQVREMSKGTGVFIPQSTHPRRRYRGQQGAKTNKNKQFTNPRGKSNVATHTTFSPAYPTNINGY